VSSAKSNPTLATARRSKHCLSKPENPGLERNEIVAPVTVVAKPFESIRWRTQSGRRSCRRASSGRETMPKAKPCLWPATTPTLGLPFGDDQVRCNRRWQLAYFAKDIGQTEFIRELVELALARNPDLLILVGRQL
jgi:hypothetical protein